jgi:hypothetical protein
VNRRTDNRTSYQDAQTGEAEAEALAGFLGGKLELRLS